MPQNKIKCQIDTEMCFYLFSLIHNFAHFMYYLFSLIGYQNIDCSCTFFFRHMSCLNKSNMKFHLISSMARCGSSSFFLWKTFRIAPPHPINILIACVLVFRLMLCLSKSYMKLHLISSMVRCASLNFSVWRNMKNIYIFFRQKSSTRHTLPLMKLGEISYMTYLGMAYA